MQFTCAVRQANVGDDPELVDQKVAPALEVVSHCCLNGKLSFAERSAGHIILDSFIAEQLHNHIAALTPCFAAILVTGHQNSSYAKVIPCNLIHCFPLSVPLGITPKQRTLLRLGMEFTPK